MRSLRRTIVPFALAAVVVLPSCTGGGEEPPSPAPPSTSSPSGRAPVNTDIGNVEFVPGEYEYDFNGIRATLSVNGNRGSLVVRNASGDRLGKPGMYVIVGDGDRYEGRVAQPAAVADGGTGRFRVSFPEQVTADTIGLAILVFGGANAGAMAPVLRTS